MDSKRTIIISAINFTEGGPLTILRECLDYLDFFVRENEKYKVIAIVFDRKLFNCKNIDFIEIKKAKYSWLKRIHTEYFYFNTISKKLKPYLWFSLHDISPKVRCERQAVYCHNPTPFYKTKLKDIYYNYKVFLFSIFYKYLYKININKNNYVVVQQNWMRDQFSELYNLPKKKVIVAYPSKQIEENQDKDNSKDNNTEDQRIFFYPAYPRPFKNFEVICEAVKLLNQKKLPKFKIILSINGSENKYSQWIIKKYGDIKNIDFVGVIPFEQVKNYYALTDCLIFPSKLETWGLPISEFTKYLKPMIIADLPYAHETASKAQSICFFNPEISAELANIMEDYLKGDHSRFTEVTTQKIEAPKANNWEELFNILLK